MPPDESPEIRYERLKKQLQDAILRDYPNPERKGCPGDDALKALAGRPLDDDLEGDPQWHHVTHCSECYREYLAYRAVGKERTNATKVRVAWAVAAAVVITAGLALFLVKRGQAPTPRPPVIAGVFRPRVVD